MQGNIVTSMAAAAAESGLCSQDWSVPHSQSVAEQPLNHPLMSFDVSLGGWLLSELLKVSLSELTSKRTCVVLDSSVTQGS